MSQTISNSLRTDAHDAGHRKSLLARDSRSRGTAEMPTTVTRVLKMPLRRDDIDEVDRPKIRAIEPEQQPTSKPTRRSSESTSQRGRKPSLTDQLRHCLSHYELLKKQVLCAELTQTSIPNQTQFEKTAQKLLKRITSLRQQLAATRKQTGQSSDSKEAEPRSKKAEADSVTPPCTQSVRCSSGCQKATSVRRRRTIQISVGESTARILKAFADAGKSPSALVQRALWRDRDVLDAALLLGLKPPAK